MSSSRSPGFPGAPDFVQNLHENGAGRNGHQGQGLFLKNYWRTRRRGRRNGVGIAPDLRALVDYGIAELMRRLRFENPGLNVRLPSHINPPFRAQQWTFQALNLVPSPSILVQFLTVSFGGNLFVPEGLRGVLSSVDFYGDDPDSDSAVRRIPTDTQLTLYLNGQAVPGWNAVSPGFGFAESVTDIAGFENKVILFPSPKVVSPINIEAGDTLQFAVVNLIAGNGFPIVHLNLAGYLYPIEVEADGIVGTLADRGGGMVIR
jgi:hypothetical protein